MTLESRLRSLDAAAGEPSAERRIRSASLLDNVVADAPEIRPRRARTAALKVGGLVAAGAAIAALAFIVPGLGQDSSALASWTPTAESVSDADLAVATAACEHHLSGYPSEVFGGSESFGTDARWVLSERRGDLVALVLWQPNPDLAFDCLVVLPEGSDQASVLGSGLGGGSGPALDALPGTVFEGTIFQTDVDGQPVSIVGGAVGEDVVALTIHAGDQSIDATIEDGRFVAWWPGAALTEVDEPSGEGGPEPIMTYDLTLADGTVLTGVGSTFPE